MYIGVPYPQLVLNYQLDNSETWLECSLGCVYVHYFNLRFFSFWGGFWGKFPQAISLIYLHNIWVPYLQLLLNYPLDNSETWLDCSLGCVYVH